MFAKELQNSARFSKRHMTIYRACTPIDAILWICRNRLKTHFYTINTNVLFFCLVVLCLSFLHACSIAHAVSFAYARALSLSLVSCSLLSFFLFLSPPLSHTCTYTSTHTHRKSHFSDLGAGYTVLLHQQNYFFVNIQPANAQFSTQQNGEHVELPQYRWEYDRQKHT